MKKTLYLLLSLAALLSLSSCKHDLESRLPADAIGFRYNSTVVDVSTFRGYFDVSVVKSGSGRSAADFEIKVDEDALNAYNEANGTSYAALKKIYYKIENEKGSLSEKDVFWTDRITWDINEITWFVTEGTCVIPLTLTSTGIDVTEERSFVLVHIIPTNATLDNAEPVTYFTSTLKPEEHTFSIENRLSIDASLSGMDLEFTFTQDESLVRWYNDNINAGSKTGATLAPAGLVTIPSGVTIKDGESGANFTCTIDVDMLYDEEGNCVKFDEWLMPVRIKCISSESVVLVNDRFFIHVYPADGEIPDPVGPVKDIMGPWDVLEGWDLSIVAEGTSGNYPGAGEASVDKLVDGLFTTEWWSPWETENKFPMVFVFDMREQHLFDMLYIADALRYQGQYRQYRFSTAKVYKGAQTEWKVIAEGYKGYDWIDQVNVYECPIKNKAAGRYLKFEILNAEWNSGDYIYSHGRLAEIYGHGI